jgi:hypothetical protein
MRVDAGQPSEIDVAAWTAPIPIEIRVSGAHVFTLELHDSSDRVVLSADGTPLGDSVTLELVAPTTCPELMPADSGPAG